MSEPNSKLPNLSTKIEEFISTMESQNLEPLYKISPQKAREFLDNIQKNNPINIDAEVKDTNIFVEGVGTIDLQVVRPINSFDRLPAILYLHGGGWIMGGKDSYERLIKQLAVKCNCSVIFVDYNKAPEYQYPKALEQIFAVLDYLTKYPQEFNIDKQKISIVGDSAGGNMATVIALKAKLANLNIEKLCLLYPVTNAEMDTKSYNNFNDGPWLTKKSMEYFFDAYIPNKKLRKDPFVSPLFIDEEDLIGFPKTLVLTAENDVLRDEGEAFASKLDSAGVDVLSIRVNGAIHDFLMLNPLADTFQAKWVLNFICEFLTAN